MAGAWRWEGRCEVNPGETLWQLELGWAEGMFYRPFKTCFRIKKNSVKGRSHICKVTLCSMAFCNSFVSFLAALWFELRAFLHLQGSTTWATSPAFYGVFGSETISRFSWLLFSPRTFTYNSCRLLLDLGLLSSTALAQQVKIHHIKPLHLSVFFWNVPSWFSNQKVWTLQLRDHLQWREDRLPNPQVKFLWKSLTLQAPKQGHQGSTKLGP
jgi:hypothetical protein